MKKEITKEYFVCEQCKEMIYETQEGVLFQGKINETYNEDEKAFIGKNILNVDDVNATIFHKICLLNYIMTSLNLSKWDF